VANLCIFDCTILHFSIAKYRCLCSRSAAKYSGFSYEQNPLHLEHSKEVDDNSPTKNDVKDAKVIAQLIKDGRYAEPTIPQGVFAELRVDKKLRDLLTVDLQIVQGQVHNWIDRYFPEFFTVFKSWEGKAALHLLKLEALSHDFSVNSLIEFDC
jgi:transposase